MNPRNNHLSNIPHDIYHNILSLYEVDVLDIIALKQTCRALRTSITSVALDNPAIYREKLTLLARTIPTGLPQDLSPFVTEELEAAALSSYAVERRWRSSSPKLSQAPRTYIPYTGTGPIEVTVLKILPGGRWIITGVKSGVLSVWDTVGERLVAEDSHRAGIYWIGLELKGRGEVMMAVAGDEYDHDGEEVSRASLTVFSLQLDPPPTRFNNEILLKKGMVFTPRDIQSPTIKGDLACATHFNEIHYILVYDWQNGAGNLLCVVDQSAHPIGIAFAPSLVILPETILVYQRFERSPFIYTVKIPELHKLETGRGHDLEHLPIVDVPHGNVVEAVQFSDLYDTDLYIGDVVEVPISTPSSISLIGLAVETEIAGSPIMCHSTKVTSEPSSDTHTVLSTPRFQRSVRVSTCTQPDALAHQYFGQHFRPLMALGHTGKRAVWVESALRRFNGGLVGFSLSNSDDLEDGEEQDTDLESPLGPQETSATYKSAQEKKRQRQECFVGNSALRQLPTPSIDAFDDITAMGFDESTATVAVGDAEGKVYVLNYGPRTAVRRR